jgi:hypothetical protein
MAKLRTLVKAGAVMPLILMLAGCSGQPLSTREKGTLAGGVLGAGTGAIVGSAVGAPGSGAAIGGALGAGTGLAVGNALQNQEVQQEQTGSQISHQQREIEQQRQDIERLRSSHEMEQILIVPPGGGTLLRL